MKKNLSKIIFLTAATALLCTLLSLTALAATSNLLPKGVSNTEPDFVLSGYSDVDQNDGWVMISSPTADEKSENSGAARWLAQSTYILLRQRLPFLFP